MLRVQDEPLSLYESAGQSAEEPVQYSGVSQPEESLAARQSWLEEANWQEEVQQALEEGSHTLPLVNLQSVEQHLDPLGPASHSSPPGSRMPLPHCCVESVSLLPGLTTQSVSSPPPPNIEHTFPTLHGENFIVFCAATGDMMWASASLQLLPDCGQHVAPLLCSALLPVKLHPLMQS